MDNTYFLLTTTVRKMTHVDRTPLQTLTFSLPFILIILCLFIITIFVLKSEYDTRKTSKSLLEPDTISGKVLYNSLQQTKAYYKHNRTQMAIIFICAIFSCFVGLTILLVSIFYFSDEAKTMGTISGTVVSFISGTFFWIYKQCYNQVQLYFNELIRIQNISIAIELAQECTDEAKNANIDKIINFLIKTTNPLKSNNTEMENQ